MSGIYLKGLKMPKEKPITVIISQSGKCYCLANTIKDDIDTVRLVKIEAVKVPDHGRLIDKDALPNYDKPIGKMMMFGGEYVYTQTAIDNAPTIIPADKDSEL